MNARTVPELYNLCRPGGDSRRNDIIPSVAASPAGTHPTVPVLKLKTFLRIFPTWFALIPFFLSGLARLSGSALAVELPASEEPTGLQREALTPPGVYIPLAFRSQPPPDPVEPEPPVTLLFCSSQGFDIPDNDPLGRPDTLFIDDDRLILDLDVSLNVDHTWVGDLIFRLTHEESGQTITLINQPGFSARSDGCGEDDLRVILDDEITGVAEEKCSPTVAAISGIYRPQVPLASFDGESASGAWTLTVSDNGRSDQGRLNEWCLAAALASAYVEPEPPPIFPDLPDEALIAGVNGRSQSLPLDCESRSAVDWAAFFGERIDELRFFDRLPSSENPDLGFVGDVYGRWGQVPPNPYGVHAEPVAALLREYGLSAYAHRPLSWDGLRAEIAAGNPVIAWIVGTQIQGYYDYVVNGTPLYYLPPDGNLTIVAPYEHTVIVTGYTKDAVTFLNGGRLATRSLEQFLDSWSVLGNMAVTTQP